MGCAAGLDVQWVLSRSARAARASARISYRVAYLRNSSSDRTIRSSMHYFALNEFFEFALEATVHRPASKRIRHFVALVGTKEKATTVELRNAAPSGCLTHFCTGWNVQLPSDFRDDLCAVERLILSPKNRHFFIARTGPITRAILGNNFVLVHEIAMWRESEPESPIALQIKFLWESAYGETRLLLRGESRETNFRAAILLCKGSRRRLDQW